MHESISSPPNPAAADAAQAYCAAEVRRFDPDRYFTSLFADAEARRALISLYAFNLEIAKIRETVSEPMLGQIRLQWWREAIDGIYAGRPRDHAVVTALAETVARHAPGRERFEKMIDGRERDLEETPFDTLEDLLDYVRATSGELSCLAFEVLGARDDAAMTSARDAGTAWALSGLLRAVPFHAAQGRSYLPGISASRLADERERPVVRRATETLVVTALETCNQARRAARDLPKTAHAALLHNALTRSDLRRIEKSDFDPFAAKAVTPGARRLRLLWANLTGRL